MPRIFLPRKKNLIKTTKSLKPVDILKEWVKYKPDNIEDIRGKLPKHATKKWSKRSIDDIKGLCVHQIAGHDNPYNTAAYHVKHFPARTPGAPTLCYTFYLGREGDRAGKIYWCNDIESVTWSQGWAGRPGSENVDFLSIVCGGDFSGPGHKGPDEPTLEEMLSLLKLIKWLCYHLGLDYADIYQHADLGKPACPGYTIGTIVDAINEDTTNTSSSWGILEWQKALVLLGYDLGNFGPDKDGCDGYWGGASKAAIIKFQKDYGISKTGFRDKLTRRTLEREIS